MNRTDPLEWTERELQDQIVAFARIHDWMAVHFGGDLHGHAYYDSTGFPDLLLVHAGRGLIWFRELKSRRGKLTARQEGWQRKLADAGLNVDVWRPADWPDIVQALSFGAARVA